MKTDTLTIQQKRDASAAVPTLEQQLRAAVRHLNFCGIFSAEEIASDSQVSRILADMAALAEPARRAA